jgi:hypothetical protein
MVSLLPLLAGCQIHPVSAEDRLFLKLSVDFLGEYQLPKQEFQGTTVGGLSGITYDRQRDCYYAISDDRSDLTPARFYTLKLAIDSTNRQQPRLQKVEVEAVTPLLDQTGQPYAKGAIDPEGIALSPLNSVFIANEGIANAGLAPTVGEYDLKTGQLKRSLSIPTRFIPDTKLGTQNGKQTRGVGDNLGFESLTLSPGNSTLEPFRLFTATESSLVQDSDEQNPQHGKSRNRMLHYMVSKVRSLFISEQLYPMEPPPPGAKFHGLTELLAIDSGGHFISLERSFGSNGFNVKLFQLATGSATDTSAKATLRGDVKGVMPIQKKLLLDLNSLGIKLDNLEGLTLGAQLPDRSRSLVVISDDNFRSDQITQVLLFRLKGI